MSKLEELQARFQLARGEIRLKLEIIKHSNVAYEIRDNDGLIGYAKSVEDALACVALQFKTAGGARKALNSVPQEVHMPAEYVPPELVRTQEPAVGIQTITQVDPAAQAIARRLAQRAIDREPARPGLELDKSQAFEADSLGNPGDPLVLYSIDPDPSLG